MLLLLTVAFLGLLLFVLFLLGLLLFFIIIGLHVLHHEQSNMFFAAVMMEGKMIFTAQTIINTFHRASIFCGTIDDIKPPISAVSWRAPCSHFTAGKTD